MIRTMRIKRNFRPVIVLFGSIAAFVIYYTSNTPKEGNKFNPLLKLSKMPFKSAYVNEVQTARYSGSLPYCRVVNPNPWDDSIQKYLKPSKSLICSRLPLLTYVEQLKNLSTVLKIDEKASKLYKAHPKHLLRCYYCLITRINQNSEFYNSSADSLYVLSNCTNFENQILLPSQTEFLLVSCLSKEKDTSPGKSVYKDVHPVISITPKVNEKLKILEKQKKKMAVNHPNKTRLQPNKPNIIILGIDSLSKLNFRRTMPKTLNYLQQNSWIEYNGYNKVGENTFPNLMAILSGQTTQTLEKICWANLSQKVDDCPALWKDFNKKGYVTLYAEDTPSISTFNLQRTGFVEKPTDYYMRPFMVAAHELLQSKILNGLPVCLGQVLIVDHIFNYAKRFFRVFNNHNYFTLLWLNSLTHNDVNIPRALDISLYKFLNELTNIGTYNNSFILLLSDHGVRFGEIRETLLGYIEERLPFLFIWCPTWFREKYPQKYKNLVINRNRVTSPFDIYVTMKKLLKDSEGEKVDAQKPLSQACPKCKGLLEEQPKDRTCADAGIDANWCLCSEYKNVNIQDETAQQIGMYLYKSIVNYTNALIQKEKLKKSLCSKWKFVKVFRMEEILLPKALHQYSLRDINNTEVLRLRNQQLTSSIKFFIIIIELRPGKTKFESTVRLNLSETSEDAKFAFLESPKRLDSIYLTSECVKNRVLKQFCYCVHR